MLVSRLILAFVAAASSVTCLAQDTLSIGSVVASDHIKQLLESDNPRLIAWGAYFASRSHDASNGPAFVTLMSRNIARWTEQYWRIRAQDDRRDAHDRRKAMQAMFSALIEDGDTVPLASLLQSLSDFPTETLILGARLPPDEVGPFLHAWCDNNRRRATADEDWRYTAACTPVTAMLLARNPPPGFAASILKRVQEDLSFWVFDGDWELSKMSRGEPGNGRSPACPGKKEDETLRPSERREAVERELSQWPPLFTYLLQNSASPYPGTLLVDAGGLAVTYRRIPAFTMPTACFPPPVDFFEDVKRHLLAEMLETGDDSIPWPEHQETPFFLHNVSDFVPALQKQVELAESRFRHTAQALEDKGWLTPEEAATIRPTLIVTVIDGRAPLLNGQAQPPPPLPVYSSTDPLIRVGYNKR